MPESRLLAVCMPVFNAEAYIERTMSQILEQTFSDFTLIITDDCSTDKTFNIINDIDDPRILLFKNTGNLGPVPSRNAMLQYCIEHGFEYMALMDADDQVRPDRLEKQLNILSRDPSLAICGSSMKIERTGRIWIAPTHPADVKTLCIFGNPIPTSTATIRLRYMQMFNLSWQKEYAPCADYHLWYRMLFEHNLRAANTGDVDMVYSYSSGGVSHGRGLETQEARDVEVKKCILRHFNSDLSSQELHGFMKVALYRSEDGADALSFLNVSRTLIEQNQDMVVSDKVMRRMISHRAFVFLAKCKMLDSATRAEIRSELVLPRSAIFLEFESSLVKFKQSVLDRSFPVLSYYLAFLYKKARKVWTEIRGKAA